MGECLSIGEDGNMLTVMLLFLLTGGVEICGVRIFWDGDDWDVLLAVGIGMMLCLPIFIFTGFVMVSWFLR